MLKAKDVVVLLKVHLHNKEWTYEEMAEKLSIGTGELHRSLKRCTQSHLFRKKERKVQVEPLYKIIIHAVKFVYPASVGHVSRGVATAHSAPPLNEQIQSEKDDQFVWEHPEGNHRGMIVSPLYPKAIQAALNDQKLYACLALVDALRIGQTREQKIAKNELRTRLLEA